jgi:polyisoprenoid-binding protein YceI
MIFRGLPVPWCMNALPLRSRPARKPACGPIRTTPLLGLLLALLPAAASAAARVYRFDPVHTQVWFSVAHEAFSHPRGRVRIADGWFSFDPDDWSTARVDVVFDLTTLDLGDADWNRRVTAGGLLDTARWPRAHYVGDRVEQTGAHTGIIHGRLTLHGIEHPLDVAFTVNAIGYDPYAFHRKAGFSASATIGRSRFGLTRYTGVIGEDIAVHVEIEGINQRGGAAPAAPTSPEETR